MTGNINILHALSVKEQIISKDGTKVSLTAKSVKSSDIVNKYAGLKNGHQASVNEEKEEDDQLFYACHAASTEDDDTWLINSCCTSAHFLIWTL